MYSMYKINMADDIKKKMFKKTFKEHLLFRHSF